MPKNAVQKRIYNANTIVQVSGVVSGSSATGDADTVDGIHASTTATANTLYPLGSSARYPAAVLPTDTAYLDAVQTWTAVQTLGSPVLNTPTINGATLTGTLSGGTFANSTLTVPTIADLTNAQHAHGGATSGGATVAATLFSGAASVSAAWTFNAGATIAAGQNLGFGTDVSLSRKTADVLQLGSGDSFQSPGFSSGVRGWNIGSDDTAEFNNIRVRGEFHTSVFSVSEIHATGGSLLVLPAYLVFEDVTSI